MFHVDKHEDQIFFLRVLVLAEQGVYENACSEFLMNGTDKGYQVPEQEQSENLDVIVGLLEVVQHVLHGCFVNKSLASVNIPNEDAQGKVCADARQEKPGTNNHGGGDRTLVHFILQNHYIVYGMRKPRQ